tara:strand:+ start:164 stop:403 length:240 start_codon:yes stop_codon:yes gene_type:complete
MLKYIDLHFFVVSFALGLLLVYCSTPPKQVVNKFPTPANAKNTIYKDGGDGCYKYEVNDVKCEGKFIDQPIMEGMRSAK